ncbi:MAG: hypothetical protein V1738_03735, partial [Patescibacteria group bacterium]
RLYITGNRIDDWRLYCYCLSLSEKNVLNDNFENPFFQIGVLGSRRIYKPDATKSALDLSLVRETIELLKLCGRPAVHEAGHALVAYHSRHVDRIVSVKCNAEIGQTINYIKYGLSGLSAQWEQITIELAGMAAEIIVFGKVSSSRSRDDLVSARQFAEKISVRSPATRHLCPWQDEPNLGTISIEQMFFTDRRPDTETIAIMKMAYRRAKALLICEADRFARLTIELAKAGQLQTTEISCLLNNVTP